MSDSYRQLKEKLVEADRAQQHQRAVRVGERLREDHEDRLDAEDWYRIGRALRRADRPGDALDVCRRLYRRHSEMPQVRTLYAWCVYDLAIKDDDSPIGESEEEFMQAADAIVQLTSDLPPGTFSPLAQTVFKVVRRLKDEGGRAEEILEWTDRLDPGELSDQVGLLRTDEGTERELPSDRERWYSARTRALHELERYQACLDACEEALQRVARFSGENQVWIQRRRALCREELGQFDEALEELQRVLRREPRWFVHRDVARMYARRRDWDTALAYGSRGALEGEVDGFRWGLFKQLADVLEERGDYERAHLHGVLALALREEQDWPIGDTHRRWADRLGVDPDELPASGTVVERLRPFWQRVRRAALPAVEARVLEYDRERGRGYAELEDGERVLVRADQLTAPSDPLEPGDRLEGLARAGYDRFEQQEIRELVDAERTGTGGGEAGEAGRDSGADRIFGEGGLVPDS